MRPFSLSLTSRTRRSSALLISPFLAGMLLAGCVESSPQAPEQRPETKAVSAEAAPGDPGAPAAAGPQVVRSLNGLTADVEIVSGGNVSVTPDAATHSIAIAADPGVETLNGLGGDVTLAAGQNVSLSSDAGTGTITIDAVTSGDGGGPTVTIRSQTNNIAAGNLNASIALSCPSGEVSGGGFRWGGPGGEILAAYPDPDDTFGERYIVSAANPSASSLQLTVYAVCLS